MAESSSLRRGAGSAFHVDGPFDSKAAWTVTDCLRRWNDEAATHSGTQTASTKVARNWLTHVHLDAGLRRQLNISTDSLCRNIVDLVVIVTVEAVVLFEMLKTSDIYYT